MPKILYSLASPYASKARMAAACVGYAFEPVLTKTDDVPADLVAANPLGKIPTLITDEGKGIFDSKVITQFLNRASGGKLMPKNADKRQEAELLESLSDGICDCAIAIVIERRFRPAEKQHQPWIDLQWSKVTRALDHLEANPPKLPAKIHAGHIALAACLGYLTLRFPDWNKGRQKLKRWQKKFGEKFPELGALLPK